MTGSPEADILIAGVGHPLMGDDALGLEVIRKLEGCTLPARARLFYAGATPLDILGELAGIKKLIIIDALTGIVPGSIVKKRLKNNTAAPINEVETHGIGLVQTLTLAQELHPEIDIVIIGAGIAPEATPVLSVSPHLRERIPELIRAVEEEIAIPIVNS